MSQPKNRKNTTGNHLARQQRLRKPAEFKQVYRTKQWGNSDHFSFNVLAHDSNTNSGSKLGVTVSKKVSNRAVIRNQIKRQIREFYRHHSHSLLAVDLVISAKPSSARVSKHERQKGLEVLWEKVLKWQRWYDINHRRTEP